MTNKVPHSVECLSSFYVSKCKWISFVFHSFVLAFPPWRIICLSAFTAPKRARILIWIAWSLSALFSLPAIYLNKVSVIKGRPQCWITLEPWEWKVYISLVATSLFFIPAIIIAACYSIIVTVIWRRGRNQTSLPTTSSTTTTGFGTTTTSG